MNATRKKRNADRVHVLLFTNLTLPPRIWARRPRSRTPRPAPRPRRRPRCWRRLLLPRPRWRRPSWAPGRPWAGRRTRRGTRRRIACRGGEGGNRKLEEMNAGCFYRVKRGLGQGIVPVVDSEEIIGFERQQIF